MGRSVPPLRSPRLLGAGPSLPRARLPLRLSRWTLLAPLGWRFRGAAGRLLGSDAAAQSLHEVHHVGGARRLLDAHRLTRLLRSDELDHGVLIPILELRGLKRGRLPFDDVSGEVPHF